MKRINGILKRPALFKPGYPRLDWIQVEITTRCNGDCLYCPQHAWRRRWQGRDMALEIFESLVPAFKKTGLVYLQGWGEPFLHPDFFRLLQIAKSAGTRVGTTTNGTLIDQPTADRLVAEGLDIVALSLAGLPEKNDLIRKGTRLGAVLNTIDHLNRAKNQYGRNAPAIHIAYMLLGSQVNETDRLPDFLAGLGADQVVVSSLSLVTTPDWRDEAILAGTSKQWAELAEKIQAVREVAGRRNVNMHFQLVSPLVEPGPCHENIKRALVIGVNGDVSPCVMTCLPESCPPARLTFGNITDQPLNDIWRRPGYRAFRRRWASGDRPEPCRDCLKSRMTTIERPAAVLVPDF
jgi:radical SAM protein with 4Fe4S-binding SPASM domain